MKRITAWLLAFGLIVTCAFPTRAAEIKNTDTASPSVSPSGAKTVTSVSDTNMTPASYSKGSISDASPKATGDETATPTPTAVPKTAEDKDAAGTVPTASPKGTGEGETFTPSPAAAQTSSPEATRTASPGASESPEASPSGSPDATPSATPTGSPDVSPSASPSASPDASGEPLVFNNGDWNSDYASDNPKGGIEVILRNALPIAEKHEINAVITLEKDGNRIGEAERRTLKNNSEKHPVSYPGLEAGTYRLEVAAPGFVTYGQYIEVDENTKTVEIHTGVADLKSSSARPGVLLIGDINGDGKIDESDRSLIIAAMSEGGPGGMTDLNGDGVTDILDLQFYAGNRSLSADESINADATVADSLSPDAVKVNTGDTTQVQGGDLQKLLQGESGSVKFQNSQGGAISEDAPVEIGFNLQSKTQEESGKGTAVEQIAITMGSDTIESGVVLVETADGNFIEKAIWNGQIMEAGRAASEESGGTPASTGSGQDNLLEINLGKNVAVKKVTFVINKTSSGGSLAEISRVEFLNDMEKRIPEPDMNIPKGLSYTAADKSFDLTWGSETNITGYEVEISYGGKSEIVRAASNSLEVKSFDNSKLKNGEAYQARVRSVNGTWASPWSDEVSATPVVSKAPDAPDNLKATGGYRCVRMSWKNMEDTDTYNVFYKKAGDSSFQKIEGIEKNQYEINGLEDQTVYEVYVTGVNVLGESAPSIHSEARTSIITPAEMPNYKLINESNGKGKISAHILDVSHGRGSMVASSLDTGKQSALGVVDKDYGSCYQVLDWDDGAAYVAPNKGLLFKLDDYYEMSYITFAEPEDIASYAGVSVYYYDREHPEGTYAQNPAVLQRTDVNGRKYYLIKLAQPITANKVRLGFSRGYNLYNITIAEVNFYHYDSLEDDILALYADDLHTSLKEGVNEETIAALQKRLDTKDEKSGEYHPERILLQRELDNAKGLLTTEFSDIIQIQPKITAAKDRHLGFGGLNAWQPLGVTAYEGEQVVIYVGHESLKTGSNSALKLIATQYHAEAGAFASEVASLKVGRNEITIPAIQSLACEGGGALYVQYTGNNDNDRYAVRVSGGAKEPVLNLYGVHDTGERQKRIAAYVAELETHVAGQKEQHKQLHESAGENNKVNRDYDKQNCILGATDIVLDKMMLSVSAEQILAGLGKGSVDEKADKLNRSLHAMDEMMEFFYHHKGLSNDAGAPETDRMPAQHLNIRYMRMFAGAFMYASGNHIGIEWGSVPALASSPSVTKDEDGRHLGGYYFGWGISHEIGHNINQGSYAYAEVTNNYFAQLTKSTDSNDSVRFTYDNVYKKVTSGTVGRASNVFTQLAMYWQLHLAYDRGYNYKMYDSYQAQHDGLFYARVDSYSRNTSLAPGGLKLGGDRDQNIMRLACAAAEKDLTEFFVRWGFMPDAETMNYARNFPAEERALYYLTDDARVYEMENGTSGSIKGKEVIGAGTTASAGGSKSNEITISIECAAEPNVLLGYEIARYHYEDGKPVRQVVGFSTENTYVDHVYTINNRVVSYEVIAVDKFGYRSAARKIGDVRISHDGSHDKSMWSVTTNMTSGADEAGKAQEEDPCEPAPVPAINRVIDGSDGSTYEGNAKSGDAAVLLRFHQVLEVCGLKYTVKSGTPIGDYTIEISVDGESWTTVKAGRFEDKKGSQTVYFENADKDPWVCTYDAAYVRLKAPGQSSVAITEIDVLGPSGDSISFGARPDSTEGAVGILQEDYFYERDMQTQKIPAGSLIFTGSYKGNPAYNVVVLYDEEGGIVGGTDAEGTLAAEQIILARVPENGLLGEVSDGIWIYWIAPADGQLPDYRRVRAQLYRVDNALTNERQRLVSDTLPLQIPENLDKIILKHDAETEDGGAAW